MEIEPKKRYESHTVVPLFDACPSVIPEIFWNFLDMNIA
jgi:hypothetical protein